MMLKTLLATSAIALTVAAPALAGSLVDPIVEPMPVIDVIEPASDWTGFYAGAQGNLLFAPVVRWGGGVHAGYLYDMGDFVIGAEGNYNFNWPNLHRVGLDAILGYDAGDVMPHATLGGAWFSPGGGVFGVSAGAGVSIMAADNVMLTGRYRFTWYPVPAAGTHEVLVGVSFRF